MSLRKNLDAINPKDMTAEQQFVLGNYLHAVHATIKDKQCQMSLFDAELMQFVTYDFSVTRDIIMRYSRSAPNEVRYEVIATGPIIGKGKTGEVRDIEGTLQPRDDKSVEFKDDHRRVDKKEFDNAEDKEFDDNLAAIQAKAKYAHIKGRLHTSGGFHTVMRKIEGQGIGSQVKQRFYINRNAIHLFIQLLRACEEQLKDNGIYHLDLHEENVLVNGEGPYVQVSFIDFSHSMPHGTHHSLLITGGNFYGAPEQFLDKPYSTKTDTYAIGKIAAELFGLHDSRILNYGNNFNRELAIKTAGKEISWVQDAIWHARLLSDQEFTTRTTPVMYGVPLFAPFTDVTSDTLYYLRKFSNEQVDGIFKVIAQLTRTHPQDRATVADALLTLEGIIVSLSILDLKERGIAHHPGEMHVAYEMGNCVRKELRTLAKNSPVSAPDYLDDVGKIILSRVIHLKDDPHVIECFLQAMGIRALKNCRTAKSIPEKVIAIKNDLNKALKKENLLNLKNDLVFLKNRILKDEQILEKKALLQECEYLSSDIIRYLGKKHQSPSTLDAAVDLTNRLHQRYLIYKVRNDALLEKLAKQPRKTVPTLFTSNASPRTQATSEFLSQGIRL